MNLTLRERLIRAEQRFLLAVVSNDEESLKVFSQEWSQLARDIENTKAAGQLDDDTAHLLSKASQAIENMAVCVLESGVILQESLTHSIGDFIQDIPTDDPSIASLHTQTLAPYHLLFSNPSSSMNSTILGQQKLLDPYAYCWLMQNIHDPYPNSMQMQIISDVSGTSTAQVELWFQEARDSIGWSKLSRDFFEGSVNATVAAARRVYLERDKKISFDIMFSFAAVKTSAETLFSEHPSLQGKNVGTGSVGTIRTMAMGQDHHMGSSPGEYVIDPDNILVLPQVDFPAPPEPLSDLSDNESEEEDTTPPPSIAGCKRLLAEDEFTSQVADLGRPQKRPRCVVFFSLGSFRLIWAGATRSINRTSSSELECPPLLSPTFWVSSEQITYMSAIPASPFPSLHPLSTTPSGFSPGPPPSISQRKICVELDEDSPEYAVSSAHAHVSVHGIRKRRLSQCVSPAPSKRQRCLSIPSTRHSGTNPTPSSDGCRGRPPDSDEFLQPMLQMPLDSDFPINLGVFDWNSIPDPLAGTASSICM
jgi:Homeobox KN domain